MLVIPKGPKRIVCLTEEPTEILYALGESDRISGISAYTVRPPEAKQRHPVVSAFIDGSVRKITRLNPDLVVGFSDIQAELAKKLIAANLNVLIFNQRSVQEILSVIDQIGRLVHRKKAAQKLIQRYIDHLDHIRAAASNLTCRPKVYFEEWDDPTITAIQWVSELIEIAGGCDVFANRSGGKLAKDRFVFDDEIIESKPELIFASWCGKPFKPKAFAMRFEGANIPALDEGELYEIPAEIILQPGPAALTDGVSALHHHILRWHANR